LLKNSIRVILSTVLTLGFLVFLDSNKSVGSDLTITEIVTQGGDDVSYRIPLSVPIIFDGVSYTDVYATTNSVITFGAQDGTFWDYPLTPSISILSRDWWAIPSYSQSMWFIIRVSDGGFQIDGSYLPYGTTSGEPTRIVITAQILNNGTVSYTYTVSGPLYGGERTGARLNDGSVVSLEEADIREVNEPVELQPEPVAPEPESTPTPTPSPTLNAPQGLTGTVLSDGSVFLDWEAPSSSGTEVERYAVSWSTSNFNNNGWGVSSTDTQITLDYSLFESTAGVQRNYQFRIRSDNDTLSTYSDYSDSITLFIPTVTTPEPEPEITPEPTESPTLVPTPEPSIVEPTPTPSPVSTIESSTPVIGTPTTKEPEEVEVPTQETNTTPNPQPTSDSEVKIEEEQKLVETTEDLLEKYKDTSIPASELLALGIDFKDLPEDTVIVLENGVELTAGVLAGFAMLENPSEIIANLFTNPKAVLSALGNVGADMNTEKREEAQTVVIASVIVTQIAAAASMAASSSSRGGSSSGSSSGGSGGGGGGAPAGKEGSKPRKKIKKTRKYRKVRRNVRAFKK
jgi:hypothetical protein